MHFFLTRTRYEITKLLVYISAVQLVVIIRNCNFEIQSNFSLNEILKFDFGIFKNPFIVINFVFIVSTIFLIFNFIAIIGLFHM